MAPAPLLEDLHGHLAPEPTVVHAAGHPATLLGCRPAAVPSPRPLGFPRCPIHLPGRSDSGALPSPRPPLRQDLSQPLNDGTRTAAESRQQADRGDAQ